MKGRTPTKAEQAHMDRVRELGCIVCRNEFEISDCTASIHHIEGKTKESAHYKVLPLCFVHHQEGVNNPLVVSRHPYKAEFERRYGTEQELLQQVQELIE